MRHHPISLGPIVVKPKNIQKKLKCLDVVQVASIYAVIIIDPIYYKFHDIPFELLKFVDGKVDESLSQLECNVSFVMKQGKLEP
ncbi:stress-related protein-like [Gossypium australe]|uniref:Stress-related protein-like n=1 Tax=Gossypium australe TaxID=47621 RepID=A0A5B6V064_9ROSI|nr:stress-related protein-like [Gossypium australe]